MKLQSFPIGLILGAVLGFGITKIFNMDISRRDTASSGTGETAANKADSAKWQWADSLDAVKAAPNSHHVLFENDKVRILEVTVPPFGLEPMHTHKLPSVMFGSAYDTSQFDIIYYKYAYDSAKHLYYASDSIRQHSGGNDGKPNLGYYMEPEGPHRIKNLSNVRIDAFRVEFKPEKGK